VHVLGGAVAPRRILGGLPANWTVHPFDALTPGQFLPGLDFFVYYPEPSMLEAFGMAPAEAMAAGVPTVLPPIFEPLFGEGALYAEPDRVRSLLLELADDPERYAQAQRHGPAVIRERFGCDAHRARFAAMGVAL
jgi:glycosyltransferase involved in cell wall biosynthesis